MPKHYKTLFGGEWVKIRPHLFSLACCDCSLVHDFYLQWKNKELGFVINRNNEATNYLRKKKGIIFKRKIKGKK